MATGLSKKIIVRNGHDPQNDPVNDPQSDPVKQAENSDLNERQQWAMQRLATAGKV